MEGKAKISSQNLTQEKLNKLKELFPDLFNLEGKINIQSLYDLANEYSYAKKEKYEFNWAGKLECQKLALEPTNSCLLPDQNRSLNFEDTKNIIIEGDNLESLKTLYQPYFEKIKCIYIDPPYNTGNDFIYDDKREEGKKAYWQRNGVIQEGIKLETNPESTGRKHSLWCSFIHPRLMLSRNLLSKDGVIFVSIDDNEVHNLRKIMDEIFGEENFVADFIWKHRKSSQNDIDVSLSHNHTICYAKDRDNFRLIPLKIDSSKFSNPDNDPRGNWVADPFDAPNVRSNLEYPIINPTTKETFYPPKGRHWRFSKERYEEALKDNRIIFGKNGNSKPQYKRFESEAESKGQNPFTIWDDVGTGTEGTKELLSLFDKNKYFDTPKPSSLIEKILQLSTPSTSQILDFFAGSGTTAHATLKLNVEEKIKYAKENYPKLEKGEIDKQEYLKALNETGSRKFILTQLPEYTNEKSEAFKAGYKTISDICIERVKRAGKKITSDIKAEKNLNEQAKEQIINSLDFGFKTYQLKDTNIPKPYYEIDNPDTLEAYLKDSQQLELLAENKNHLLYEITIKNGFDLSVKFKKIESVKENEVYQIIADNRESALICVDKEIHLNSIAQIGEETTKKNREWQFFCFDNALSITVKTNLKNKVKTIVI